MDPNPQDPSRGTGLWLQRADTDGVRSDAEGKAPEVIALDNRETLDVYRALRGPDRSGMTFAQEAAANLAFARALLIEARSGREGGEIDFDVDASQVIDPEQGIVPRRPMPAGGERSIAIPVAGPRNGPQSQLMPPDRGVSAVSESELLLADVPLIVEGLLWQARHLSDLGAPIEIVNAILDHVVDVREGRG